MTFDVTRVDSMQWNRTSPRSAVEDVDKESLGQQPEISPETLAQVRKAISAEVASNAS